jgi:hypothetical protein
MMVTCISEASGAVQETLRTLRFTMSAARIRNHPVRFLDPQEKLILELKEEIKRLRLENQHLRQVNLSSSASSSRSAVTTGGAGGGREEEVRRSEEEQGDEEEHRLMLLSDEEEGVEEEEAKKSQRSQDRSGDAGTKDSLGDSVLFVKILGQTDDPSSPLKRVQVLPLPPSLPPSLLPLLTPPSERPPPRPWHLPVCGLSD